MKKIFIVAAILAVFAMGLTACSHKEETPVVEPEVVIEEVVETTEEAPLVEEEVVEEEVVEETATEEPVEETTEE